MKLSFTFSLFFLQLFAWGQISISGQLQSPDGEPVVFANVALYNSSTKVLAKVETSDLDGKFEFQGIAPGNYYLNMTYVGLEDKTMENIEVSNKNLALGTITMTDNAVQLETATITANRSLVEVKSDRTVFNVQGTVNSAGETAIGLLRMAPGVMVDNNNNVTVLGRSGVLVYIDGKRLPLAGTDLSNYLQNITAEQIEKIDIISNPGAKYEAEGNAGIIDIILKKDKNVGYNASVNATGSYGFQPRGNVGLTGNYRNKIFNAFGNVGFNDGKFQNEMFFINRQNNLVLDDINKSVSRNTNYNVRLGTDFFISQNSTIGFLVNHNDGTGNTNSNNSSDISKAGSTIVDSVLVANNTADNDNTQSTFNVNYVYNNKGRRMNLDLDYGRFRNDSYFDQPNRYFSQDRSQLLTEILTEYWTPTDIDIYTAKLDYEMPVGKHTLGLGSKFSKVATGNTFLFFDIKNEEKIQNNNRSNDFSYDENVLAGYVSMNGSLTPHVTYSAGLRAESTDATGDLVAYDPDKAEAPVKLDYINWFPNAGLTYTLTPQHMFALNYGRRINRPDYNVLNPFRQQMTELSFSKGNPRLNPEIVNNVELGYTYNFMYNFKLAYSKTDNQITRLIGPDDVDPRAGFISWDNLATQTIYSANISAPFTITKWWSSFVNLNASYTDNQADYGENGKVDVQAYSYNIYQQSTFQLPNKWQGEISGWYSGPGVWGGVFLYDPSWSLNVGLQRRFFNDQLNVKATVSDIFFQAYWSGISNFNGLEGTGRGNWDSRRGTLSISYNFGNNTNIKSRRRSTGIEAETKRASSGGGNQGQE